MVYGVGALWTIDFIRNEIQALEDTSTYQKSEFYRDFARRLQEILGNFQVVKGDSDLRDVDIIYANPERAVAKITEGKTTNLPLLSLQFEGITVDTFRRRPMECLVEEKYWDSQKQRAIRYMALAPVAATLLFSVNVWGKYIEEVNQLTEQILLKFRPNLPVDLHPEEVYQAYVKDVNEASEFSPGDRQDRVVKRAVRFEVEAYIPTKVYRFTNTGEIETINYEVYLEEISGLQTLESWYAGGGLDFAEGDINRGSGITTVTAS